MTNEDYKAISDFIDLLDEEISLIPYGYSTYEDIQDIMSNFKNFCKDKIPPIEPPYTIISDVPLTNDKD